MRCWSFVFAGIVLFGPLFGCTAVTFTEADLTITSPAAGSYVGSQDVAVEGTAQGGEVRVNGQSVVVTEGRWRTVLRAEDDGPFSVVAAAAGSEQTVDIVVDTRPPLIDIREPAAPVFAEGGFVLIRGRVDDASPVTLTSDGESVTLGEDGSFSIDRELPPGGHRFRIRAVDAAGHEVSAPLGVVAGDFAPYEEPVTDAIAVTLGTDAFDDLNQGLNEILNGESFRGQIRSALVGSYDDIEVRSVDFDRAEVALDPRNGGLLANASIHGVRVDVRACFRAVVRICKNADLWVDRLQVDVDLDAGVSAGRVEIETRSAEVEAHGFGYNVSGVPGFIEGLFRNRIRREVENVARDGVAGVLNEQLPALLGGLSLGGELDVLGVSTTLRSDVDELSLDASGLYVHLDFEAWATAPVAERMTLGYLRQPHAPFGRAVGTDVSASIALDVLNSFTFAMWSGFATQELATVPGAGGPLTLGQLGLLLPAEGLSSLGPADTPIAGQIDLVLPPVVSESEGTVQVVLPDVRVALAASPSGGFGSGTFITELSVFVSATVEPSVDANGVLRLQIGNLVVQADPLGEEGLRIAAGEELDTLLEGLAPALLDGILGPDGFRLPGIYGFEFVSPSLTAVEGGLDLNARLAYVP
ncbi:MAG: hypothetical protein AAGF12_06315 [Myxococcota bacterium]